MRTRKAAKGKPATVTLTEEEIMLACDEWLRQRGFRVGELSYLILPGHAVCRCLRAKVKVIVEAVKETDTNA
jgi:hypothetical protein